MLRLRVSNHHGTRYHSESKQYDRPAPYQQTFRNFHFCYSVVVGSDTIETRIVPGSLARGAILGELVGYGLIGG